MTKKEKRAKILELSKDHYSTLQSKSQAKKISQEAINAWRLYAMQDQVVNAVAASVEEWLSKKIPLASRSDNDSELRSRIFDCFVFWDKENPGRKIELPSKEGEAPEFFSNFWKAYLWAAEKHEYQTP